MKNNFIPIKKIRIEKLFGLYDYEIEIKDGISIVIGENGIGKTKILNIVYSVLNDDLGELINYDFKLIKIYFIRGFGKLLVLKKSDIYKDFDDNNNIDLADFPISIRKRYSDYKDFILSNNIRSMNDIRILNNRNNSFNDLSNYLLKRYPSRIIVNLIKFIYKNLKSTNNTILKLIDRKKILYLPTYRRIEEDIINLGMDIGNISENKHASKINLINFGMKDIKDLFVEKEEEIKNILAQGIASLTGNILNELYNIKNNEDKIKNSEIDLNNLEIVLNRVKHKNTNKIIEICKNKQINNDKHLSLKSVLLAFIEQYEKQQVKEEILKKFVAKCNGYLNNKCLFYDDINIKISIKLNNDNCIDLANLSSGEKQIISILAKIYLNPEDSFIILFDEPELSLSITWQEKLISDILDSGNIYFLMTVTHSPFIVSEGLQKYANFISK